MEFCERMYNMTNASIRDLHAGIVNVSREVYVKKCVHARSAHESDVSSFIIIPYALIFLLSVVGNTLVILTLVRHKKMRTITNIYLLNLAISDLLLAVLCMPFTLVPMLMQEFIFGPAVCILIRYAQAVSVGVSCGTLVAISIERFYGICQALRSRRWQTPSHSYRVIFAIWFSSLTLMVPIAVFNKDIELDNGNHACSYRVIFAIWFSSLTLMVPIAVFNKDIELDNGNHACREIWPSYLWESLYTVLLDVVILVLPLFIMGFSYGRIARELWSDFTVNTKDNGSPISESADPSHKGKTNGYVTPIAQSPLLSRKNNMKRSSSSESTFNGGRIQVQILHPTHNSRALKNKKRVVKMLCVVVLEYFICWTPLFLLNSWTVLDYLSARDHFTPLLKSSILLLSYMSSCIHPITYCFMNQRFRQSFVDAFRCCIRSKRGSTTATMFSELSHSYDRNGLRVPGTRKKGGGRLTISWRRQQ